MLNLKITKIYFYSGKIVTIIVKLKISIMEEKIKHLQLPNELIQVEAIAPKDLVVYLALKSFENWDTHTAFPSLEKVAKLCSCTSKTVSSSIKRLVDSNFLDVEKKGRGKLYTFKKYENFECFSLDFLKNENLTFTEKAYLAAQQQFLIKDNGFGKTTYSSYEMSDKIHMPPSTIRKCDNSLVAKNYLTITTTNSKDEKTGLIKKEKIFDLEKFGQAVVFVLQNHEESIESLKDDVENLKKTVEMLVRENNELKKSIAADDVEIIAD